MACVVEGLGSMFPNTAVVGPVQVLSASAWTIEEEHSPISDVLLGPSDGLSEHSQGCTSFTDGSVPNTHNPLPRSQTTSPLALGCRFRAQRNIG